MLSPLPIGDRRGIQFLWKKINQRTRHLENRGKATVIILGTTAAFNSASK